MHHWSALQSILACAQAGQDLLPDAKGVAPKGIDAMSALSVQACGMTTAIGLTAPAACAALRARLDNFSETRFISRDGDWILGAGAPLAEPWRGTARMVHMLAGPLRECMAEVQGNGTEIPILLCLPETARAGRFDQLETRIWDGLSEVLGHTQHKTSRSMPTGR
jgi:3-oxoacyl-[acyl-carrier-protein] synthase-1